MAPANAEPSKYSGDERDQAIAGNDEPKRIMSHTKNISAKDKFWVT